MNELQEHPPQELLIPAVQHEVGAVSAFESINEDELIVEDAGAEESSCFHPQAARAPAMPAPTHTRPPPQPAATAHAYGEQLCGARVSVRWEVQDAVWQWFPGTVTDVRKEEYGRNKGVVMFQVCYDADNTKEWSELNAMVCGEVGDEEAEWSLLAMCDVLRRGHDARHVQAANVPAATTPRALGVANKDAMEEMRVPAGDCNMVEEVEEMCIRSSTMPQGGADDEKLTASPVVVFG